MSEARVLRQDRDGLATLTLNRPDKLNALDNESFHEFDAHLADLERQTETIGCVVLRGSGRGFCSGADLTSISPGTLQFKPRIIDRLAALPQPTIAAVHGVCYTGGLELALACDFIVADAGARFADTHGKWGLVGAWGMVQRLPRRIGAQAAKAMMMTGQVHSAAEAHAIGLVDLLAGEGEFETRLAGFAGQILANSWHTNGHTKRLMRLADGMSLEQALQYQRDNEPGRAPDYEDRIAAFSRRGQGVAK
ncbi:enoyl-CoA hydratase/isomerase family protein [Novosphingobium sp. TH158]|uniref:enoyl-CoA hydratase/isomerase family protein n=1 Tax=Novosphingobium sp. TH158 TaxID=2067455 RepID=UPI000C7E1689|nr:enoyl-CoA hydratase/isomerase family protein [Novosphingobium sp. TH158]PLK24400.1 enoyl-CoA hydratase [Novosphingobium sp. TH158]